MCVTEYFSYHFRHCLCGQGLEHRLWQPHWEPHLSGVRRNLLSVYALCPWHFPRLCHAGPAAADYWWEGVSERRVRCGGGSGVGKDWSGGMVGGLKREEGSEIWETEREDIAGCFLPLAVEILGWIILWCGGCPVHCKVGFFFFSSHYRVLSNNPGLYPLDTPDAHSPKLRYWECPRTEPNIPWKAKLCLLRIISLDQKSSFLSIETKDVFSMEMKFSWCKINNFNTCPPLLRYIWHKQLSKLKVHNVMIFLDPPCCEMIATVRN